jgi:dihydrofolate reductase
MTAPIVLVLARAENGVIGADGHLPWGRLDGDLVRFKDLTMGKPVIMGRKTWDSLPFKPLPGRTNIVLTRNRLFAAAGAVAARTFEKAMRIADEEMPEAVMVIGGADIFAQALPYAQRIELTVVYGTPAGDTVMPEFPPGKWRQTARTEAGSTHAYVTLERRKI